MPGVRETMKEFAKGRLHSGSKHGPVVTNAKQAIAIALNSSKRQTNATERAGKKK